jgi:hypothetical protein
VERRGDGGKRTERPHLGDQERSGTVLGMWGDVVWMGWKLGVRCAGGDRCDAGVCNRVADMQKPVNCLKAMHTTSFRGATKFSTPVIQSDVMVIP